MDEYDRYLSLATLTPAAAAAQRRGPFFAMPRMAVVQTDEGPGQALRRSLQQQTYPKFEYASLARLPQADYYLFLPGDARLSPEALYRLAMAAGGGRELLYADEDCLQNGRRINPLFKPDYSPHTLLCRPYMGRGLCLSKGLLRRIGYCPDPYGLSLLAAEAAERVVHVPLVLFSFSPKKTPPAPQVLAAALRRQRREALVLPGAGEGSLLPRFSLPGEPMLSVILADEGAEEALKGSLLAVEQRIQLFSYELILAVGRPLSPFLRALQENGVRLLSGPAAPCPRLQAAAEAARGRFLLFLRPGCQPLSPDFAQRLMEWANQRDVGAVGPLITDGAEGIYRCGTVIGLMGGLFSPGQGCSLQEGKGAGLLCPRNVSGVPPEAFMVRRDRFWAAGGLDVGMEQVGYSEELCLRLRRRGLFSLCVPGVRFSGQGLPRPMAPSWGNLLRCRDAFYPFLLSGDPFYNPNLRMDTPLPRPALPPRPPLACHRPGTWA